MKTLNEIPNGNFDFLYEIVKKESEKLIDLGYEQNFSKPHYYDSNTLVEWFNKNIGKIKKGNFSKQVAEAVPEQPSGYSSYPEKMIMHSTLSKSGNIIIEIETITYEKEEDVHYWDTYVIYL